MLKKKSFWNLPVPGASSSRPWGSWDRPHRLVARVSSAILIEPKSNHCLVLSLSLWLLVLNFVQIVGFAKVVTCFSPFAKQNQAEVWQSLLKLLLSTTGVKWSQGTQRLLPFAIFLVNSFDSIIWRKFPRRVRQMLGNIEDVRDFHRRVMLPRMEEAVGDASLMRLMVMVMVMMIGLGWVFFWLV